MIMSYCNVGKVIGAAIKTGSYKATKYVSPRYVIRATRRHKIDRRDSRVEFVVTLGAPNYLERDFIKECQKSGEPFPIKKIQLR